MDKEIMQICLNERKIKLEELNKELEEAQKNMNKSEFEEDMYDNCTT